MGFIDLAGQKNGYDKLSWIRTPGTYLNEQADAVAILAKYGMNSSVIVFIPSAELGYFISGTPPLAEIHTFDATTNPYYSEDLPLFFYCNDVDIIAYNSHNSVGMYQNFDWTQWPPPRNYVHI
jgi:hypothetical protein